MSNGMQSIFGGAAIGESSVGLADQVIWEGDIMSVQILTNPETNELSVFIIEGMEMPEGSYEYQGLPAVFSITEAMNDPDKARQDIKEQVEKNILIRGGNEKTASEIADLSEALFVQFYAENKDTISSEIKVSAEQKCLLFSHLNQIPTVLSRALEQDDIKIVVDDSSYLMGSVPESYNGSAGIFLDGNIFLSYPYEVETISEEAVHYVDKKLNWSSNTAFTKASETLVQDPHLLNVMGFVLNKDYKPSGDTYDMGNSKKLSSELLADMYIMRSDLIQNIPLDFTGARILALDIDKPETISRIEGLEMFYNQVVKGKTTEEVEQFYEKRIDSLVGELWNTDKIGLNLALSLSEIPEEKMEGIFANMNNPETLLKSFFPQPMIQQLNEFEKQMEQQYPDISSEITVSAPLTEAKVK